MSQFCVTRQVYRWFKIEPVPSMQLPINSFVDILNNSLLCFKLDTMKPQVSILSLIGSMIVICWFFEAKLVAACCNASVMVS
jgi:hypothetical protein